MECLIDWGEDYPHSWEPEENILDPTDIEEYHASKQISET
jgi:hypothetical protein